MAVRSTPAHVFRENNILETQKQLVQVPVPLRRLVATVTGVKTPNPRFRRMCNLLGTTNLGLSSRSGPSFRSGLIGVQKKFDIFFRDEIFFSKFLFSKILGIFLENPKIL